MTTLRMTWRSFIASKWLFPVALFLVVVILAAFRISGTSVGAYHQILYGPTVIDKGLIHGQPQMIRSDEWLVNTAFTVSQSHFGFPKVNPAVGSGMDTSVILDLPNKDWSELFKPQNWSFFILPLEQAFAFKWWFIGYLLIMGGYFLTLALLPTKRLFAALLSLGLFFAPFIQWWYQTMTLAPIYYSCFAIVIFINIVRAERVQQKVLLALALAYVSSCFALILYPPFQIPTAGAILAVCLGYLMQYNRHFRWRELRSQLWPVLVGVTLALLAVAAFFLTREATIHSITGTVYPGHRIVASGGFGLAHFMDGFLSSYLHSIGRAANYIENQSEASNFVYLWPYLLIPSVFLSIRQWRERRTISYPAVFVNCLLLIFTARLFLSLPQVVSKVLLLSSIPHNRLLIGFGLLNFIQLLLVLQQLQHSDLPKRWALRIGGVALATQLAIGYSIRHNYPLYVTRSWPVVALAGLVALAVYFVLRKKTTLAAAVLLILAFGSTYRVHPLYIGLGELTHSRLDDAARHEPNGTKEGWAYLGSITTINLLSAGGLKSYSATYPYPQMDFFKDLDPKRAFGKVYNRYGFAMFAMDDPKVQESFKLNGQDSYFINYKPCDVRFKRHIHYIASQSPLSKDCLKLDTSVSYPNQFFYIYSVR